MGLPGTNRSTKSRRARQLYCLLRHQRRTKHVETNLAKRSSRATLADVEAAIEADEELETLQRWVRDSAAGGGLTYACDCDVRRGEVRIEEVPDARLIDSTDALVRVTRAGICGSDLWPYKSMEPSESGRRMGHEFIGLVEAVGGDVCKIKAGELSFRRSSGRTAPVFSADAGCTARASTEADTALAMSTADKAKRCGFPRPTERSWSCRSVQTSP